MHPKLIEYCSSESTYPEAVSLIMEWAFSSRADQCLVDLAGQRMAELPASVLQGDFLACDAFDVRDRVEEIEQPALVICGADDQMTPVRFSDFLTEGLPNAHLEIVPNAGHMVMLEQPEIVAELVKGFLDDIHSDGKTSG